MIQNVPINTVKANPNNPRIIKDDKFAKLVKSIKEFPDMLNVRPIVVNKDMVVLGGNMRLKAIKEAGYKEVAIEIVDWTEQQQKEFIVKDNVGYGEWDWNDLANNWDAEQLQDWGLDIPGFMELPSEDELTEDNKNKPPTIKITFETIEDLQQAEIDIIELIDRKYPKAFFSVSAGEL
jgi:ParB-like chromosome segregation protein Spo0J